MHKNAFERLPISRLIEIIGAARLESIQGVLEALNLEGYSPEAVYTKGFLASLASKMVGLKFLKSPSNFSELINTLSIEELTELGGSDGNNEPIAEREALVARLIRNSKRKELRRQLFQFLGFSDVEIGSFNSSEIIPSQISLTRANIPYKPLKDYQYEVFFQAASKLQYRDSRFILQMPTGSGKTRTAMEVVSEFLNANKDSSVVWLAHSTELCDQASECFLEVWPHLAQKDLVFYRHYGRHRIAEGSSERIGFVCASFQATYPTVVKTPEFLSDRLYSKRLIVVDEAHKVVAPTYKAVTKGLVNDGSSVMGLTATPGRSYANLNSSDENEELSTFFFNSIVSFDPKGVTAIEYLREKGVLAKAKFEPLNISGQITLSERELDFVSKMFEIPSQVLDRIGKNYLRNAEILSRIMRLLRDKEARSIIFFAASVEQSIVISSLLKHLGISAEHVDGNTAKSTRDAAILGFRKQDISVLCNYEVLSTGFDAPLVDCVFIARPTASVVLYSQLIGRGLRGPAIGGKERCLVVNVMDNIINLPSMNSIYSIFEDYWDRD